MDIREEIIYLGKKMVKEGLVASTWGNISGRVGPNQIYITPSGMEYESLEVEDITLIDLNGNVLEGKRKPSSEFQLHCEIYKAREDVQGIVHTHSKCASAFAVVQKPIPPLIEDMVQVVGGEVSVAQYALPGTKELATNAVWALGSKGAVLLANHGVVGVGYNLQEAYKACLLVEKTAHIYVAASCLGKPCSLSTKDVQWMRQAYLTTYGQK